MEAEAAREPHVDQGESGRLARLYGPALNERQTCGSELGVEHFHPLRHLKFVGYAKFLDGL